MLNKWQGCCTWRKNRDRKEGGSTGSALTFFQYKNSNSKLETDPKIDFHISFCSLACTVLPSFVSFHHHRPLVIHLPIPSSSSQHSWSDVARLLYYILPFPILHIPNWNTVGQTDRQSFSEEFFSIARRAEGPTYRGHLTRDTHN